MAGIVRRAKCRASHSRKPVLRGRSSAGMAEHLPVERHHLVDPAASTSKRSAPSRACLAMAARRSGSPASVAIASPRLRGGRVRSLEAGRPRHQLRRGPSPPPPARPARPPAGRAASASASTRPCVSVCEANAKRSAPATTDSASSRGIRPGSATRPARSGAAARVRGRLGGGATADQHQPQPWVAARGDRERLEQHGHVLLRRQAAMAGHDHRVGRPAIGRAQVSRWQRLQRPDVHPGRDDPHQRPPARSEPMPDLLGQGAARRHDGGAARPEVAQVRVQRPLGHAGQRSQVVAVVAEPGVMREDQPGARCAGPCDAPSDPTRRATGRGRSPAQSRGRRAGRRWAAATACGSRAVPVAAPGRTAATRMPATGPAPRRRVAPHRRPAAARPAGPRGRRRRSPRASVSVETVTPERYGRYDSPKTATRSAFTGRRPSGGEGWVVGDTGFEPVTSRM